MQKISDMLKYQDALSYLDSFSNYEKVRNYLYNEKYFDLGRVLKILSFFDNPHKKFRSIHIAGTKGKGSTATICANILARDGYKVGLYTSPHLVDFRERIKIVVRGKGLGVSEKMISKREVIELTHEIKNAVDKIFPSSLPSSLLLPTTFELYTVLGFLYFAKEKIDVGVIEVGLGGRLDATNVISPDVCIITTIGYDHMKELGNKLSQIAKEKCGIIKNGVCVVSSPQRYSAMQIIKKVCQEKKAKLHIIGQDVKFKAKTSKNTFEKFDMECLFRKYRNLELSLVGEHQVINASSAICAVELFKGKKIEENILRTALKNVKFQGRMQIIQEKPIIILDGAHNPEAAKVLVDTIKSRFKYKRLIFIISIFQDKDIKSFMKIILNVADKVIITEISNPRVAKPQDILTLLKENDNVVLCDSLKESITLAKQSAEKDDIICITGSLYLVGEVLKLIKRGYIKLI